MTTALQDYRAASRLSTKPRAAQSDARRLQLNPAGTPDYETSLRNVAEAAIRSYADLCFIEIGEPDGTVQRIAAVRRNPALTRAADALRDYPLAGDRPHLAQGSLLSVGSYAQPYVALEDLHALAQDQRHFELLEQAEIGSFMIVPLTARGRQIGVLTLISAATNSYTEERLRMGEQLAAEAALAIDNARLHRDAELAVRARDEVLGIVSHDLRNGLNTIFIATDLLLHAPEEVDALGGAYKYIALIRSSAERMERLTRDLLEVQRVEAGYLRIEPDNQELASLIADSCRSSEALALVKRVAIHCVPLPPLPHILADRARITQVMSNLIGNAIKFTPEGGKVTVSARPCDDGVCISIADNGPGLQPEDAQHVFDRFWQASDRKRLGIGLGLTICKYLIDAHGGRIWVDSKPGAGATFSFTLPFATSPPR